MMNKLLFFFLTITYSTTAQQIYEFDYVLEYETTVTEYPKKEKNTLPKQHTSKKLYYTNSIKNNYHALIIETDSLNYKMHFKDENGITFKVDFLKSDLDRAENIEVDCKFISRYSNIFKHQINHYNFFKLSDTLINQESYYRYKLASINSKREKRKKLGTEVYLVKKGTEFHLPFLEMPTAYEEWKSKKNIPNGIYSEKKVVRYDGLIRFSEKLLSARKINKKIRINDACNFIKQS